MKNKLGVLLVLVISLIGCSSADMSAMSAWGRPHIVKLYACDGHVIQQWVTTGKIENESNSNGYYFKDDATGKMVMVDGTVVITVE